MFPTVDICRAHWPGTGGMMATLLNSLFFVVKISLLPNYCVKYYDWEMLWYTVVVGN